MASTTARNDQEREGRKESGEDRSLLHVRTIAEGRQRRGIGLACDNDTASQPHRLRAHGLWCGRLVELPHQADDIASLRAAGYRVIFDIRGTRDSLVQALLSAHPESAGTITAGDQVRPLGALSDPHVPGIIRVGANDRGRWPDGKMYGATLVDFDGERYLARWNDGDEPTWILPSELEIEEASSTGDPSRWKVGMKVRAQWKDGTFYGAKVTKFDGGRFWVEWADGDTPSWVSPGAILPA